MNAYESVNSFLTFCCLTYFASWIDASVYIKFVAKWKQYCKITFSIWVDFLNYTNSCFKVSESSCICNKITSYTQNHIIWQETVELYSNCSPFTGHHADTLIIINKYPPLISIYLIFWNKIIWNKKSFT